LLYITFKYHSGYNIHEIFKKLYFLLIVIFLLLKGVQRNGSHNFLDVFYSLKKKLKGEYLSILCKLQFTTKKKIKKSSFK